VRQRLAPGCGEGRGHDGAPAVCEERAGDQEGACAG